MSQIPDDGGDLDRMRQRKSEAIAKGGQAFLRLLNLAETGDSGQAHAVARFIASTYNGQDFPYDACDLRLVDIALGDDRLACLDALRWAQADLYTLVPDGAAGACPHRPLEPEAAGDRAPCPTLARPAP